MGGDSSWQPYAHLRDLGQPERERMSSEKSRKSKTRKSRPAKPVVHGPLYTKKEAASYLSISERKLDQLLASKQLRKCKRNFGNVMIPESELDRFIGASFQ